MEWSVTQENMRLSIINGTAFADFGSGSPLTSYLGCRLTISDSAGKKLVGWIKAAGTGETYGSELLSNTAFEDTTGLTPYKSTLASIVGGQSGNCLELTKTESIEGAAWSNISTSNGMLICNSFYGKLGTGTTLRGHVQQRSGDYHSVCNTGSVYPSSWTQYVKYGTIDSALQWAATYGAGGAIGQTQLFDTVSLKQVLTPASTGVTIVSDSGGSTYNWTSEESGFNRNDSSGYTFIIESSQTENASFAAVQKANVVLNAQVYRNA